MTQTILNLGTGGAALNGRNGSTAGADTNDALFLDWPGDNAGNYVYLPGVNGNFMSVPDEAALDITGDIDIRVRVAMDDWTPAGISGLVSKWLTTGNQRSYSFRLLTTGVLRLVWSADGTAEISKDSTAAVGTTDGAVKWVRATLDVDNGASGNDVNFFTSDDGATWTQLGSTVTTASTTSVYSSSADLSIGQVQASTNMTAGKFYRAQILDGIGGTTVLDVNTSVITSGSATSFTALTGQTVTISRSTAGRKSVAVVSPVWLFGTDDYMEVANDALINFGAADSFTVLLAIRQWATPANFGVWLNKRDANDGSKGYSMAADGTNIRLIATIDDGPNSAFRQNPSFTTGGRAVLSTVVNRTAQTLETGVNGGGFGTVSTSSVGSLVNPRILVVGANRNSFNVIIAFQDFELLSVAVFRRALTQSELTAISNYYSTRWP
jgi:hypothetical protein